MNYTAEWVKQVVQHPTYQKEDYARFQSELRRRKKTGLLEMMQRMLKEKLNEHKGEIQST